METNELNPTPEQIKVVKDFARENPEYVEANHADITRMEPGRLYLIRQTAGRYGETRTFLGRFEEYVNKAHKFTLLEVVTDGSRRLNPGAKYTVWNPDGYYVHDDWEHFHRRWTIAYETLVRGIEQQNK